MKILYIDQYFSTREGRSGTRSYEFARRWAAEGHDVLVITSASAYSHMRGQREWLRRHVVEGVHVWSLRIPYAQTMSHARRAWAFTAFMTASTAAALLAPRPDVIFASSTPLSVGVTGAVVAWLRTRPFVFEVRDLWPRAPIELGAIRNPLAIRFFQAVERWIYRRADRVNALSPGMRDGVREAGETRDILSVIPNACDEDLRPESVDRNAVRERWGLDARVFVVVYAGALGPANDVGDLLDVAAELRRRGRDDVAVLIAGEGSQESALRERVRRDGLSNVRFAGVIERLAVGELLAASDLGVTCFAPLPVLATNSPNKFFDYLACGLPQITNSPGWVRPILEDTGAGVYWPHGDAAAGADAVMRLADDPALLRRRAQAAEDCAKQYARPLLGERLLDVFRAAGRAPARGWSVVWQGVFDRIVAAASLVILGPFLLAVAALIRRHDGGPALFRSRRVGLDGREFDMLKFRTMVENAAGRGLGLNVETDDARITPVGRFLRAWSLDEIPQLLNVLAGDMRLVGPRPALPEHVARYDAVQRERLRVRPGLTGWAQINGRNALTWSRKLELDAWYARRRSFWLDVLVVVRTFGVVLRREGLYETDAGLADDFNRFDDTAT